jgi:hypothetical protein
MNQSTWHDLSSTVETTLQQLEESFNNNPTLSALRALSGVPTHPYEQTLYKLFGEDYKNKQWKNIDEIQMPISLPIEKCTQKLSTDTSQIHNVMMHNLTCEKHFQLPTALDCLSGEEIIQNFDKQKEVIEFVEMVKNIPLESINPVTSIAYTRKIINEYMRLL